MRHSPILMSLMCKLLLALPMTSAIAQTEDLEWQIKVPITLFYRAIIGHDFDARYYFRDPLFAAQDWSFRRELYVDDECMLDAEPIYCSERKLGLRRLSIMRERLRDKPERGTSWLAEAYLANFSTFWLWYRTYDQNFLKDILNNDVRAQVRLARRHWRPEEQCELIAPVGASSKRPCTDWFDIRLPRGREQTLSIIRTGDGKLFQATASVRQITVLGMGDSFASGEGAPDVPADLIGRPSPGTRSSVNLNPTAAQWLDRNCHRSLLGPQARAVMQYAASNPHTEINFIYVPCSGAEIEKGILAPYLGFENSSHTLRMHRAGLDWLASLSQLNQVLAALCRDEALLRPREKTDNEGSPGEEKLKKIFNGHPMANIEERVYECKSGFHGNGRIDAVLLSIGGNDAHFFSAVKQAVLPSVVTAVALYDEMRSKVRKEMREEHISLLSALFSQKSYDLTAILSPGQATTLARRLLPERYRKLDEAFQKYLGIDDPSRVIIALYPNQNRDENGRLCNTGAGLEDFNAFSKDEFLHRILPPHVNRDASRDLERFARGVNDVISGAPYRDGRRWTIARSHLGKFERRGWCARDTEGHPRAFDASIETRRLVRTPNDGTQVQNQLIGPGETDVLSQPIDARVERLILTYGLFHPNYYGSAIIGDAYLRQLKCVLDGDCQSD